MRRISVFFNPMSGYIDIIRQVRCPRLSFFVFTLLSNWKSGSFASSPKSLQSKTHLDKKDEKNETGGGK